MKSIFPMRCYSKIFCTQLHLLSRSNDLGFGTIQSSSIEDIKNIADLSQDVLPNCHCCCLLPLSPLRSRLPALAFRIFTNHKAPPLGLPCQVLFVTFGSQSCTNSFSCSFSIYIYSGMHHRQQKTTCLESEWSRHLQKRARWQKRN